MSIAIQNLGDYEGAKKGYLKVLEIEKRVFGEDHVEYATTLSNLSVAMKNLGDYEGAKKGYSEALDIKKRVYGEDHVQYKKSL